MVHHPIKLYQQLLIHSMKEIRLFNHFLIQYGTVALRNGNLEVLKQLDDLLVGLFHFSFEKDQYEIIDLVYRRVNCRCRQVFERLQGWLINAVCSLILPLVTRHSTVENVFNYLGLGGSLNIMAFFSSCCGAALMAMISLFQVMLTCHVELRLTHALLESILERNRWFIIVLFTNANFAVFR